MVSTRNTRADVVEAAGRLFAERGYHGTSMRDLGKELGLLGSSLYAHVESKQHLLVEVVREGAALFASSASSALATEGTAEDRLRSLIAGHVDVVLDNRDIARTFLNEARVLEDDYRERIVAARDAYEEAFRQVLRDGVTEGSFSDGVDPKFASILILSVLNAIDRWYDTTGPLDRDALAETITSFALTGLR